MNFLKKVDRLFEKFQLSKDNADRYDYPFPMAVFGTLREYPNSQGNSRKMYAYGDVTPVAHLTGFLPHTKPDGINLDFDKDYPGPFEIFFYTPDDWQKVIGPIDDLEGFEPKKRTHGNWYYVRTLMAVRLLPEKEAWWHDTFAQEIWQSNNSSYGGRIKLSIDPERFGDFRTVPAWVYSNEECNDAIKALGQDSPVLWEGKR